MGLAIWLALAACSQTTTGDSDDPLSDFAVAVDSGVGCQTLFDIRNDIPPDSAERLDANETLRSIGCFSSTAQRTEVDDTPTTTLDLMRKQFDTEMRAALSGTSWSIEPGDFGQITLEVLWDAADELCANLDEGQAPNDLRDEWIETERTGDASLDVDNPLAFDALMSAAVDHVCPQHVAQTMETAPPTTAQNGRLPQSCREATETLIETMEVLLNRIDTDPDAVADEESMGDLFFELGTVTGEVCGAQHSGEAISDFLVYLAEQMSVRPTVTQAFLDGMLEATCDPEALPVELTLQGRAACAGY